jgi:hypothetical protein
MIAGIVTANDGTPVAGARVFIRKITYIQDTASLVNEVKPDAVTLSDGSFKLDSIVPDDYQIEVNDRDKYAKLISCNKALFITPSISLGTIALLPVAGFYGTVDRINIPSTVRIYAQIYGLERVQQVDNIGEFYFAGLPAGIHIIRLLSSNGQFGIMERDTIEVKPAENRDAGTYLLPFDFYRDTMIVRALLDSNGLDTIPASAVIALRDGRVVDLNLTGLGISRITPAVMYLRLRHLRLGENAIDSIPPEVGRIPSLTDLTLKRNVIVFLPGSIGDLSCLKHLDLSRNKLNSLPLNIIKLVNLEFLSVDYNHLTKVDTPVKIWLDTYCTDLNWQATQGIVGQ